MVHEPHLLEIDRTCWVGLVTLVCELQIPHEGIVRLPTVVD